MISKNNKMSKLKNFGQNLIARIYKLFKINFVDLLEKIISDCDTVLDLGCGSNSPIGKLRKKKMFTLGVDIFEKYIDISKKKKIHDDYLLLNILNIDKKISINSFDCVLLLDVVEHLEKMEAIQLIKKAEKIAKKKVIISTPNEYLHQSEYSNNIYQIHKSGWDFKIFKKLNFKIYGVNGLKFIKSEMSKIKYKPLTVWYQISMFSNLFVKRFPQSAYQFLCIKKLNV